MIRRLIVAVVALAFIVPCLAAGQPLIVSSTFDSDLEGWKTQALVPGDFSIYDDCPGHPDCIYDAVHHAAGGNPGGCAYAEDSTSYAEFWRAPADFLTGAAAAYGGELRFDIRAAVGPTGDIEPYETDHEVILRDTSVTDLQLYYDLPFPDQTVWYTRSVALVESAGWINQATGLAPTQAEMMAVLSNLDHLWILAEFYRPGMDSMWIDNVLLYGPGGTGFEGSSWSRVKSMYR